LMEALWKLPQKGNSFPSDKCRPPLKEMLYTMIVQKCVFSAHCG